MAAAVLARVHLVTFSVHVFRRDDSFSCRRRALTAAAEEGEGYQFPVPTHRQCCNFDAD